MVRQATEQALRLKGAGSAAGHAADATIYGQLLKQASMLSFNDAFLLLSLFMVLILPLAFLMKKGKVEAPAGMH